MVVAIHGGAELMAWEKVKLGDVSESCLGKMLDQQKNRGEFHPYLANVNVRWGSFDLEDLPLMKFEDSEQERYGLKYGDLVVCEGGEPGRCAIWKNQIPNMKIQKALHRVRVSSDMDYRYLFYWFLYAGKRGALDQYFTGATIKHMPGEKLKQVLIDKPPLKEQKRIADILSAYDDLIENNQKQIKLLEEAAQRLYRQWFIDLRYPGHETTLVVDGLPEGWRTVSIQDVCKNIGAGGTPSRSQKNFWENGNIDWFKTQELCDCWLFEASEKISEEGLKRSAAKMFPANSILMAIYASPTLGRLGILTKEACSNQAALCLQADESKVSNYWLYLKLFELRDRFNSIARGAGQQNISGIIVKETEITLPAYSVMENFTEMVKPFFEKQRTLQLQNISLTQTRDRLLPKLMNGGVI